jgi:hypothetical protein
VKEVFKYLRSAEFRTVYTQLFELKEVKDLGNYMETAGLQVVEFLNKFADFCGLPHFKSSKIDGRSRSN